ncbi:MAG TPA: amidohydrolase family protein [Planctomycetota bacterium]|nr:amidohydrolase family protein [Planctomycetota bacterium]
MKLVDVSGFLGNWPFRSVSRSAAELKADLKSVGVAQAWVSSVSAAFQYDPMQENERLAKSVAGDDFFVSVAVINPAAEGFLRDAQQLLRQFNFRAVKLTPNYHGYTLDHPGVIELAKGHPQLPLCIQMRLQDERGHHPLMKVPGVPAQAIVDLARKVPEARIIACAPYLPELKILAQAPNVWAELSFCENGQSLNTALEHMTADRLLFGSHAPLHYPAAEAAKLAGGLDIPDEVLAQIASGNAQQLMPKK